MENGFETANTAFESDPIIRGEGRQAAISLHDLAARLGVGTTYDQLFADDVKLQNAAKDAGQHRYVAEDAVRDKRATVARLEARLADNELVHGPDIEAAKAAHQLSIRQRDIVVPQAEEAMDAARNSSGVIKPVNALLYAHRDDEHPFKAVTIRLASGASEIAIIAAEQEKQDALLIERKAVTTAPRTLEEAIAEVHANYRTKAQLPKTYERNGKVHTAWPVELIGAEPKGSDIPHVTDLLPALMALGRDVLIAKAEADLRAQYAEVPLALSAADKAKRLAEIDDAILASQRIECAAIWQAHDKGTYIPFRRGTRPEAILGVKA